MIIQMQKLPGGTFCPANDIEVDKTTKFKSGELYEVNIKRTRNPSFHRKMFAFLNFCFSYWSSEKEFLDESAQFDVFRKHLTVLAGYYIQLFNIKGDIRIEAKSLSYGSMTPEEFEQCYNAMIGAAIKNIFNGLENPNIEHQLMGFFQ